MFEYFDVLKNTVHKGISAGKFVIGEFFGGA